MLYKLAFYYLQITMKMLKDLYTPFQKKFAVFTILTGSAF